MKRQLLSVLFIVLFLTRSFACDCDYEGPFKKMATTFPTIIVAHIKVVRYLTSEKIKNGVDSIIPTSMLVQVITTYKGNEKRRMITIWGDNGILCRPYLTEFKLNQEYVMALSAEHNQEYSVPNCGCYWLYVDTSKKIAIGDVDGKEKQISLSKINQLVQQQ